MSKMCLKKRFKQPLFFLFVVFTVVLPLQLMAVPNYIGNVIGNSTPANFTTYWRQITSENASKWQSVEGSRDQMNWSSVDSHYNYAKQRGYPYKFHVLVWGSQYPSWIMNLSQSEQTAEIIEWIQAVGTRYQPEMIDVVNEALPGHAPAPFKNALGGDGSTGWDWIIRSFELAKQYCTGERHLNDYGIINDGNAITQYLTIINLLKSRGLIDGIGIQCHQFNVDTLSSSTIKNNLDRLAATGLPIYVTELDITGDDNTQNQRYRDKFPVFYDHPSVKGITIWGYIQGQTWKDNTHLVSSGNVGASERPSMQWLKQNYLPRLVNGPTTPPPSTPPSTSPSTSPTPPPSTGPNNITVRAVGTKGGEIIDVKVNGTTVKSFTLTTTMSDYILSGNGGIQVEFVNDDQVSDGMDVQVDYIIYNGTTLQAEDQEINTGTWQDDSCGGSFSEWLYCSGYIQFNTGPIPSTTPPPSSPPPSVAPGPGLISFEKSQYAISPTDNLDAKVMVNSGTEKIAAYGLSVSYSSNYLSVRTGEGNSGVSAGTDGFISAVNPESGKITVGGFDTNGKGPGTSLHLLTIHFVARNKGTASLSIAVEDLSNASYQPIGSPRGGSATVVIDDVSHGLLGDVNGDGVVNIVDALIIAQYYVALNPTPFDISVADVNCDGTVNIVDALMVAQYYVQLITSLSC